MNNITRIHKDDSVLLLIDFQEKLMPIIYDNKNLESNICKMARAAKVLDLDFIVTQQYTKGLGNTILPITDILGDFSHIEKTSFSAYKNEEFKMALEKKRKKQVLISGIETHICVEQTVLDLLENNYEVIILSDCVSSRELFNKKVALNLMEKSGAIITTYESVIFEMLEVSGTDKFKEISRIIK